MIFWWQKKSNLFLYVPEKYEKDFWEEGFIHEINLCYIFWTKQTQ